MAPKDKIILIPAGINDMSIPIDISEEGISQLEINELRIGSIVKYVEDEDKFTVIGIDPHGRVCLRQTGKYFCISVDNVRNGIKQGAIVITPNDETGGRNE